MKTILVIDDDESIRWVLQRALGKAGYQVVLAENADAARLQLAQQRFDLVLSDIRMPGDDGMSLLREIRAQTSLPVMLMTANADLQAAVQSFEAGAFEFIAKPFDLNEVLALVAKATQDKMEAGSANVMPADTGLLIGQSVAMQPVFRAIGKLSRSSFSVLILGESGSGKELVARALHAHSPRAAAPFIALNMAAIPKDLIEAELFGHERGAFTGAAQRSSGKFEQADAGTLFLDEIGDMPLPAQTRLLRVLSDGGYYRVGGNTLLRANVRLIAATHQDLQQCVQAGTFREDLYHRLNVVRIALPPLRERGEDIPLLVQHFLHLAAGDAQVSVKQMGDEVMRVLGELRWPGNVRQLENLCRYLTVMAPGERITLADLPDDIQQKSTDELDIWRAGLRAQIRAAAAQGDAETLQEYLRELESIVVLNVLEIQGGKRQETARLLGWGRNTLTRYLQQIGVEGDGDVH